MSRDPEDSALGDVRVLDLADEKGVYCTKMLADLGAEVIKIEPPGGDKTRSFGPFVDDEPHPERSLFFMNYNTNKKSVTLDITTVDGQALFKSLVQSADVIVETFDPGYMDQIGLGYAVLQQWNPKIIVASITPFGQTGPHKDYKYSDIALYAMGGMMNITGEPEDPPVQLGGSQSIHLPSCYATSAILMALIGRDNHGYGQHIDVSIQECFAHSTADAGVTFYTLNLMLPTRIGTQHSVVVPLRTVPCKNGYGFGGAMYPTQWVAFRDWLAASMDISELMDPALAAPMARLEFRDLINALFIDFASNFTKEELFVEGQKRRMPFSMCATVEDLLKDPHLSERDFFVEVDYPELGRKVTYPGAPYRFEESPWRLETRAPHIGEHNREILGEELGLTADQLTILKSRGVI